MSTKRFIIRSAQDLNRTLTEARITRGLTQQQLAEMTRTERTYIAKIEAGHTVKQVERILGLLRLLGVSITAEMETDIEQ